MDPAEILPAIFSKADTLKRVLRAYAADPAGELKAKLNQMELDAKADLARRERTDSMNRSVFAPELRQTQEYKSLDQENQNMAMAVAGGMGPGMLVSLRNPELVAMAAKQPQKAWEQYQLISDPARPDRVYKAMPPSQKEIQQLQRTLDAQGGQPTATIDTLPSTYLRRLESLGDSAVNRALAQTEVKQMVLPDDSLGGYIPGREQLQLSNAPAAPERVGVLGHELTHAQSMAAGTVPGAGYEGTVWIGGKAEKAVPYLANAEMGLGGKPGSALSQLTDLTQSDPNVLGLVRALQRGAKGDPRRAYFDNQGEVAARASEALWRGKPLPLEVPDLSRALVTNTSLQSGTPSFVLQSGDLRKLGLSYNGKAEQVKGLTPDQEQALRLVNTLVGPSFPY